MKRNMGAADSIARIVLALIFATLFFTNVISGTVAVALIAAAVIFLLTGVLGHCPLYSIFGFSTLKK